MSSVTDRRDSIVRIVTARDRNPELTLPSASEILKGLANEGITVAKTTLSRDLAHLKDEGRIEALDDRTTIRRGAPAKVYRPRKETLDTEGLNQSVFSFF
jgi:Fe2+ or Zn2+ uptake regulation protein